MTASTDFDTAFRNAQQLYAKGHVHDAERALQQLATPGEHRETVLAALYEVYTALGRTDGALATLEELTREAPDRLTWYARLAALLDELGRTSDAIQHYERLLKRQPDMADAHFNVALLYKKAKRHAQAIAAYEAAIRLGISGAEEAYSNLGVLYSELRDAGQADEMYRRALTINPGYIPALFNRAGLLEEVGKRQEALDLYQRILAIQPGHADTLGRIANARRVTVEDRALVGTLQSAVLASTNDTIARETLYFALGKAYDDLQQYDEAYKAYDAANNLGRQRNRRYDRAAVEEAFSRLVTMNDRDWVAHVGTTSTASPVFICGMFRSGSTLTEQILGVHPGVTAGGELDLLPWLVTQHLSPFPQRAPELTAADLEPVSKQYVEYVRQLFPGARNVTDKRPNNFLNIGLIKAMFPAARIIYTRRSPRDNCLSIWFQQLGGNLSYATNLADTAHYYRQHERLMDHWQVNFGDSILTVDYDELVRAPEPVVRRMLDFLGMDWDERCLDFERAPGQVKTASVWQVREPLHERSSGRWRNYEPMIRSIDELMQLPD
ncbi:MAG: sulfotransferase [Woeseia sp.]